MWSPEEWTAFGTVGLAVVTLGLIFVGVNQISMLREQNALWRTLEACERYSLDPLLDTCLRKLRAARDSGEFINNEAAYRSDITTILNYLDSIAIGIHQGLYVDSLARDHLQAVVEKHVNDYLRNGIPAKVGHNPQNYRYLLALEESWTRISRPHFREGQRTEQMMKPGPKD